MDRIGESKEVKCDYYTSFVSIDIVGVCVKTLTTGPVHILFHLGPVTSPILVADDGRSGSQVLLATH